MIDNSKIIENINRHRLTPEKSPSDYFIDLQRKLAIGMADKSLIYLDTKYWIILRDAFMGVPRKAIHIRILERLRSLVDGGSAICPVSDAAYAEAMQQTDITTRLATAGLMDELSSGVAIQTEQQRVRTELLNFIVRPFENISERFDMQWVRAGFVLGNHVPKSTILNFETSRILQKSFIDMIWELKISDFAVENQSNGMIALRESAERVDENIVRYANQIRSFEQAKLAEFSGCVKFFTTEIASAALIEMGCKSAGAEDVEKFKDTTQRMLFNAFRFSPEIMSKKIPTLFIHAMCHAAFRWNKGRRFDSHWQLDIHHACAAIAYYDVMLTEKPLRVLIESGNLQLGKRLETVILSEDEAVLEYLEKYDDSNNMRMSYV